MAGSSGPGKERLGGLHLLSLLVMVRFTNVIAASHRPKILYPEDNTVITKEGGECTISCTAETKWPRFHLVYWLVNNSFIEDAYPDGRVTEKAQRLQKDNKLYNVTKPLVFTTTQPEDFTKTFTCVIQDPSGVHTKHFKLLPEVSREISP